MKTNFLKGFLLLFALLAPASFLRAEPSPVEYNRTVHATPLLSATTTASGQPIEYPKTDKPQVTMLLVEIPPGAETGWHKHPVPCYAYILSGSVMVELENGKSYSFHAGQAFAETVNTLHNGKNTGTEPVKIVMTAIGEEKEPIVIRPEKQ
ncbi:MAG: cupin domain-containing protein [Verrucomicrobiota bacterium]